MRRKPSKYHGCLSFLGYTGYDYRTDQFFFGAEEIPMMTPGEMQSAFMHLRWGVREERKVIIGVGPGQGKPDEQKSEPPKSHEHDYPDKPDSDGKWRCLKCDQVWNK